jgi:FkbM family methyltransferase
MKQLLQSFFYLLPSFLSEKNFLIFLNYLKLFAASYIYHHLKKAKPEEEKQIGIMGHKIFFFSYPLLINQFEEIFIYKSYRFESDKQSPLIFDCGSNIGISILYFKIFHSGSRIVAFEPDTINFRLLKKNIERNRFSDITLNHFALGAQEGFCKLYNSQAGKDSVNSSIYSNEPDVKFINVRMKKLSSFIDEKIDFMKMDVEGAEGEIMRELSDSGKLKSIKALVMEFHPKPDFPENELISMLRNNGFVLSSKRHFSEYSEKILQFKMDFT